MLSRLIVIISLFSAAAMACSGCKDEDSAPADCADGYECPDNVYACFVPYPQPFPECEVCYLGRCCERRDGEWRDVPVDCVRTPPGDAGVDAMQDSGSTPDASVDAMAASSGTTHDEE